MEEFKNTETLTHPRHKVNIDEGRKRTNIYVKFSSQLLVTCILCSEIQTHKVFGMKPYHSRRVQIAQLFVGRMMQLSAAVTE